MDVTQHPEYQAIVADIAAINAKIDNFEARAPDGYWASSARQHLRNFEAAYRRAFHDLPAAQKVIVEDLF